MWVGAESVSTTPFVVTWLCAPIGVDVTMSVSSIRKTELVCGFQSSLRVLEVALKTITESLIIDITPYTRWKYPTVSELLTKLNLERVHSVFVESREATLAPEQQAPEKKQLLSSPFGITLWK